MDNKSSQHPGMAAPRHCGVNEVLCHHLKPEEPLAENIQNQLSPTVYPWTPHLNSHVPLPTHFDQLPVSDLLWSSAISFLLKPHLWRAVTEPCRSLKVSEVSSWVSTTLWSITSKSQNKSQSWTTRQRWAADHSCMELMNVWSQSQNQMTIYI